MEPKLRCPICLRISVFHEYRGGKLRYRCTAHEDDKHDNSYYTTKKGLDNYIKIDDIDKIRSTLKKKLEKFQDDYRKLKEFKNFINDAQKHLKLNNIIITFTPSEQMFLKRLS